MKYNLKHLIDSALEVAKTEGYTRMTRDQIAAQAGCSTGIVSKYLGTMPAMRRTIMRAAVHGGVHAVIVQGLAVRDPHAMAASDTDKRQAWKGVTGEIA